VKTLIDTDVLFELRKPDGSQALQKRLSAADPEDLFLSVISIGEIAFGIARLPASAKRRDLEAWLALTDRHFSDRILPVSRDVAQLWGEITARAASAGRTLHAAHGLIAATAIHHGLRIMTRNTRDYEATGVLLFNPWED
jgi:toxin FitB